MLRELHKHLLAGVLSLCLFSTARGATIEIAPGVSDYATPELSRVFCTIRLSGEIKQGDAENLRKLLRGLKDNDRASDEAVIVAELNSPGGNNHEAMSVGEVLREFRVVTVVRKGEVCLSACALAFIGGSSNDRLSGGVIPRRYIEIGGTVGFRNFRSNPEILQQQTPVTAASIMEYAMRMGAERGLGAYVLGIVPKQMEYIDTVGEFRLFNICPIGLGRPQTTLSAQAANICTQSTRWFDPDAPSKITPITGVDAKRRLLEATRRNMLPTRSLYVQESEAKDLLSLTYMESESATDKLYADLRAVGISLPKLTGPTFEVSGYRSGFYQLECMVSFSGKDSDRYTVIVDVPVGGSVTPTLQAAPEKCPVLSRYDRSEVVNPVPNHDY